MAFAVFRRPDRGRVELLTVRRPPEDEELPGIWGLPAGSLQPEESWADAVRRAGREKLGVELAVGPLLGEGAAERSGYRLHMRVYEAEIRAGRPRVPQPVPGMTQYAAWEWAPPERLVASVKRGSLCSRLCLDALVERRGGE